MPFVVFDEPIGYYPLSYGSNFISSLFSVDKFYHKIPDAIRSVAML